MKLNEFVGTDHPSEKLHVGHETINSMLVRQHEVDTSAFLIVLKHQLGNLPAIAAERALTHDWKKHPMFGIACPDCKDQRAAEYQRNLAIANKVFDVLMKRAEAV